jgi:hypothetical protein
LIDDSEEVAIIYTELIAGMIRPYIVIPCKIEKLTGLKHSPFKGNSM